jgi:hypothetical protein
MNVTLTIVSQRSSPDFHHRGQRPNDVFDLFSCHVGYVLWRSR